ncbi:MAG: 50S ribosomal protein L17 [Patescibacteria group bacterium]
MQHRKRFNKLGKGRDHRKALLRNLCTALVLHEKIETTITRAKTLRGYVDHAITIAKKKDTVTAYRMLQGYMTQKAAIEKTVKQLKTRYADRNSGFTRIHAVRNRPGDNAIVSQIELV